MLARRRASRRRAPDSEPWPRSRRRPPPVVQRSGTATTCPCGGGCPQCRPAEDAREREAESAADAVVSGGARPLRAPAPRPGGEPLPAATRERAERVFETELSSVRVFRDGRAGAAARDLSAEAFTRGDDIAFAPGAYRPGERPGERLLAHELAHVVQQRGGGPGLGRAPVGVQRQSSTPDFLDIARRLNTAMAGLGTDEAAVFAALRALGGDQQAGDELKRVYQNIQGRGLESDLRSELSGTDLATALALLNPGGTFTPISAQRTAALRSKVRSIGRTGSPSIATYQDQPTGKVSGYQLTQNFTAQFDASATASDYAVIQWIKGEMYQPEGSNRAYWPASMGLYGRGNTQPWRFTNWVIDTPDADPRFGSNRGISISVPTTTFADSPGVFYNRGPLPAGHHWNVDARVGIYAWGAGVPTYVAGWESQRPSALVEQAWGWTVTVDPNQTSLSVTVR